MVVWSQKVVAKNLRRSISGRMAYDAEVKGPGAGIGL